MHITANGERVEILKEQRGGDRWLIAKNVPLVKPMELDTGYVPEQSVASSVQQENTHGGTGWEGTTPTVNHPRNDPAFSWHDPSKSEDAVVLAANEAVQETLGVGIVENDHWDGEFVRVDIAVNADEAEEMGSEAANIVANMENGEGLEVSSQYLHSELPPGEYDGAHRENPKAIAAPDSVALIPNGRGVCSVEDGCGIQPGVAANIAALAGADDPDKPALGLMGEGQRTQDAMQDNSLAGVRQLLSGLSSLMGRAAGPMDTAATTAETPATDPRGEQSAANEDDDGDTDDEQDSDEGAESSTDDTTTANTMESDKRKELIQFIAANSDLKEDSLEHMGDECLKTTHEMVVANAAEDADDESGAEDGEGDDLEDEDEQTTTDDDGGDADGKTIADLTPTELGEELKEQGFVTEDSIGDQVEAATNELEKEERAERIVANSAEYDEDDVEWIADLPEKEIERKESAVSETGGIPATGGAPTGGLGATGNVDGGGADDMPDLEVD